MAEFCGASVEVEGVHNLPRRPHAAVVAANHMSALETLVLTSMLIPFTDHTFVVKESLLHYPGFGPLIREIRSIPVRRARAREDLAVMMEAGVQRLTSGISVVVFPQSTRRPVFDPRDFNSIAVKLAGRAGVPIVPLALRTDFQEEGRIAKDFGRLHPERPLRFEFGPPVRVEGTGRDAQARVIGFIEERLRRWGVPVAGPLSA